MSQLLLFFHAGQVARSISPPVSMDKLNTGLFDPGISSSLVLPDNPNRKEARHDVSRNGAPACDQCAAGAYSYKRKHGTLDRLFI